MSQNQPYAEQCYELSGCCLRRLRKPADAELISDALAGMDPWRTLGATAQALTHYLTADDPALHRFAVCAPGGTLIGVTCVRYPWLRGGYLELFGLFEAYQRQGIGSEIIRWFEDQSRLRGGNIWVSVSAFNDSAYRFYRRHGFGNIGVLTNLVKSGYDEILLRKIITHR